MILCWVDIPLLRFHPHPSQCRSIGQTIGLTAYPPQRAAIFTMPPHSSLPRLFRLGALFEASDISTTSEPTVPSGIVSFGPADPACARHLSCEGSLTPRLKSGACARPVMVKSDDRLKPTAENLMQHWVPRALKKKSRTSTQGTCYSPIRNLAEEELMES